MCTICGHYAMREKIKTKDIYDMLVKMKHRGPDTHGIYFDAAVKRKTELESLKSLSGTESRIALGHSRLKILGRLEETQPYVSSDGRLTLIHNGEIYNYRELKSLLTKNSALKSESDSEVIIYLLEELYAGDLLDAVRKMMGLLDGMYALAVTDGETIVVARDPIGKKPVYFIENNDVVYFASEKKALWNGKNTPERLPPGQLLKIDGSGCSVHPGLTLQLAQIDITDFREAVELYKEAIIRSVQKRLAGLQEETLGVIFSGGIDSVLVAHLLQREGRNIVCFCSGTEDSGDVQAAAAVAADLGLELHTTIIDERLVEDILPEIIENVEESGLLQVEVAIPMYLAVRQAAEHGIRVMYTGQAADELFAGYPWYTDVISGHGYLRLHEKLWEDLNLLYSDTLEREDKLTMAHSIELRAPYLDRDVITAAMRMSPRLKIKGVQDNMRKRVHRQAAFELGVPAYLAFRKKDPAQSGSGIHGIIRNIAQKRLSTADDAKVDKNFEKDRGSLYRYNNEDYSGNLQRSYLQSIEENIIERFVPVIS